MNAIFRYAMFCLIALLTACTGVPIRSLPRLASLQSELMQADPAELMLAIQVDARLLPAEGAVPLLLLRIKPAEPGAFPEVERKLPMQLATTSSSAFGLEPPKAGRHWLVYSLTPTSRTELSRIRETFKQRLAEGTKHRGGSIAIGIEQSGMAVGAQALAASEWSSWLQTSRQTGFFELWTGSVADLVKSANRQ